MTVSNILGAPGKICFPLGQECLVVGVYLFFIISAVNGKQIWEIACEVGISR